MLTKLKNSLSLNNFYDAARIMGFLFAFGIPWSTACMNIGFYLMVIFFLFGSIGNFNCKSAFKTPASILGILLFSFIALKSFSSIADWQLAKGDIAHYRKLLAIPLLIALFHNTALKKNLVYSYLLGVCFLITPTIIDGFGMSAITSKISLFPRIPGYNVGDFTYWKNHIIHGFHVAILFSAALLHSIFYKRLRKTSILISLLAITDLLFFIKARAALICLIVIICYFMITVSKNNKKIILLSAIFAVLISSIYFTSPSVQQRVKSSVNELSSFNSKNDISTSGGTRLHYWQISWDMFLKAPLTGMGGGSFKQTLIMTNDPLLPQAHGHCHNEYISLLSQYGIVGISLFIYLLFIAFKDASKSNDIWISGISKMGLIIFAINALTDASLNNYSEGWTFIILVAIATKNINLKNPKKLIAPSMTSKPA